MPRVSVAFNVNDSSSSLQAFARQMAPLFGAIEDHDWDLDLSGCRYLGPFAAALVAASWHRASARGVRCSLHLPSSPPALAGFCRFCGLESLAGGREADPGHPQNETVPLTVHRSATFRDADPVLELLRRNIEVDDDFEDEFRTCMNEVIQNVVDHAQSETGGVSCARLRLQKISVAVVDVGVGVAASLRRRYPDVRDELDAMSRIARQERLSAGSRPSNAGLGLDHLKEIVARRRGELVLLSGNGVATISVGRPNWEIAAMDPPFPGTAVYFSIPAPDS
jgi:hypothetical protein